MEQKLLINWEVPDIQEETGEYFENQFTYDWLKNKGIVFANEQELINTFKKNGNLENVTQEQLKKSENLTYNQEEFESELTEGDYAESFRRMETSLVNEGEITLPAPIILHINDLYYGFAGNRRSNLAFKYGLPLKAWIVRLV